jgi:AcrR family transcriptional regulator
MPKVRPEYKREVKGRIASTGLRIFLRKGYRRTTMSDIARETGVSKGDLYLYFSSKADLLKEVQLEGRRLARERMAQAVQKNDAAEGLIGLLDEAVGEMQDPKLWSMWFDLMAEAVSDPELHETIRIDHREDLRLLKRLLAHENVASRLAKGVNRDDLALAILVLFHGAIAQLSLGSSWPKTRRALRTALRALLRS